MKDTEIKKKFIRYAIPTIVSMLIISLQCIIDGMFVSYGVGPQGLAGVNITMPLTSFFFSVAIMIVSGAAIATVAASLIAFTALIKKLEIGKIAGGWQDLKRIFFNGSSEMITSVATSISTYVFNLFLMRP